jgi:pimeloyl-ACP methyl ester carboxylesterase
VAEASMSNYAAVAVRAAERLPAPRALGGWSMGGLVALMAARRAEAAQLVLLEPSPPAEVRGVDDTVSPEPGTFDPEETYGPFPSGIPARPDSALARAERKRGISVPALPCPALVVTGDEFAEERGPVAEVYGGEQLHCPGLDHWDLVLDERVRHALAPRLRPS